MSANRLADLVGELHPEKSNGQVREVEPRQAPSKTATPAPARPEAIRYEVPGVVPEIAQPTSRTCWATVATMLMSWHDRASLRIEDALSRIAPGYLELFKGNQGLPLAQKAAFLATIGLQAEPPMNYTVQGWEALLRRYGPLWVTTSEGSGLFFSPHAQVMVGIEGDATPTGTMVHLVDPATGKERSQRLRDFIRSFEEMTTTPGPLPLQVVHFPQDAARATGQSYAASLSRVSYAQNPAAIIGGAALTYTILKDVLSPTRDITFNREQMQGAKYPADDKSYDAKGQWQGPKTVVVSSWIENLVGDRQEADFEVSFRYNGYAVGYITIQNTGTNDAFGWKLDVVETITPIPDQQVRGVTPIAAVELTFNFRHYRPILNDAIYVETVTLYGTGDIARRGRWTQ